MSRARTASFTLMMTAASLFAAAGAEATVYNIHLSGNCTTAWTNGKGTHRLGQWTDEVTIDAQVDQMQSLDVASPQLKTILDTFCTAPEDSCWLWGYSAGDAVIGYTLERYGDIWNIDSIVITAGAGGGTPMGGELSANLVCPYAAGLLPNLVRNAYDHDDTAGNVIYRLGGKKPRPELSLACAATAALSWLTGGAVDKRCLKGPQDGLIEYHSSGAYRDANTHTDFWNDGEHFTNHQSLVPPGPADEGEVLDHYEMKSLGACMFGGYAPVEPTLAACRTFADEVE